MTVGINPSLADPIGILNPGHRFDPDGHGDLLLAGFSFRRRKNQRRARLPTETDWGALSDTQPIKLMQG